MLFMGDWTKSRYDVELANESASAYPWTPPVPIPTRMD